MNSTGNSADARDDFLSSVAYSLIFNALTTRKISLLAETVCSIEALKIYIKRVICEETELIPDSGQMMMVGVHFINLYVCD